MTSAPGSPRSVARALRLQDQLVEHVLRLAAKMAVGGDSHPASPLALSSPRAGSSSWAGAAALPAPLSVSAAAQAWLRDRIQTALAAHAPRPALPSIGGPGTPRSSPRRDQDSGASSATASEAGAAPRLTPQVLHAIATELLQVAGVQLAPRPAPPVMPRAPASPRAHVGFRPMAQARDDPQPTEQAACAPVPVAALALDDLQAAPFTPRAAAAGHALPLPLPPPSPRAAATARGLAPMRSACGALQRDLAGRIRLDATNTALATDAAAQRAEHAALAADFAASRAAYREALTAQIAQRAEERNQAQRTLRQQQADSIALDVSLAQMARERRDKDRLAAREEYREATSATLLHSFTARAATHGHQVSAHAPHGALMTERGAVDALVRAGDAEEAETRAAKRERNLAYGRVLAQSMEQRRAEAAAARDARVGAESDSLARTAADLAAERAARRAVMQLGVEACQAHIARGIESPRQREERAWRAQDAESATFAAFARNDLDAEIAATRAAKARRTDEFDRNVTRQMISNNQKRSEAHAADERVAAQLVRTAHESLAAERAQRRADTEATRAALSEFLQLQATERRVAEAVAATEYDGWHKKTTLARGIGY